MSERTVSERTKLDFPVPKPLKIHNSHLKKNETTAQTSPFEMQHNIFKSTLRTPPDIT